MLLISINGASHMQEAPRLFYWPKLYPIEQNSAVLEIQVSERSREDEASNIGLVCCLRRKQNQARAAGTERGWGSQSCMLTGNGITMNLFITYFTILEEMSAVWELVT